MTKPADHIVKAFDEQLEEMRRTIVRMGGMVEAELSGAVEALTRRDSEMAQRIIESDQEVDVLEQKVDELVIRLLALRQPMAVDLREVLCALKVATDLERIGDYACNIAKRAMALSQMRPIRSLHSPKRMARLVQSQIKKVVDAYVERDGAKALEVWRGDEEVDEMYTSLFRELLTYMMEDPRDITPGTHLLFVARNIERIGDHATNVAEYIYYLDTGERITFGRPKADTSSFSVVEPPEPGVVETLKSARGKDDSGTSEA
ncbi:MAG: phosphate signaling complex protein PhoU [Kiloniellales bacterium]|nr:phosphate signaling complex protein PhoU [Kiloniellales bacterium]